MEKFEVEMAAQSLRDTNGTQSLPSGSGAMPNLCKLATLEGMEPTIGLEPITCRSRIRCGEWLPTNPISFQWCPCTQTCTNASHSAETGQQMGQQFQSPLWTI